MAANDQWGTADVDPRKIVLDVLNPRIDVPDTATQDQLRAKLLEFEDVLDLAREIEKAGGLFYGERIITVKIGAAHTVLEGNRRVAACQMLLDPTLIPSSFKLRFPTVSPATKRRISKLACDVAPSRSAAEPILTKRHTERGAKPWSPVAKMRRAVRLMQSMSHEQVAQTMGTSVNQIKRLIRPYKLLQYALGLSTWTVEERKLLEDEKLVTNPYTRVFTVADATKALQVHFDSDNNIVSALPKAQFKAEMSRIARDFLLPDPTTGKPRCNTRTDLAEYFKHLLGKSGTSSGPAPRSGPAGAAASAAAATPGGPSTSTPPPTGPAVPKTPKASRFFENLACHVVDDSLLKLTDELKHIDHEKRPIAASMLTRAMLESLLVYKIRRGGKWPMLVASVAATKPGRKAGADPALQDFIAFTSNFANGVFAEQNICKALKSSQTKEAKQYLDRMTHRRFQEADPVTLVSVANNLRMIFQYILEGH